MITRRNFLCLLFSNFTLNFLRLPPEDDIKFIVSPKNLYLGGYLLVNLSGKRLKGKRVEISLIIKSGLNEMKILKKNFISPSPNISFRFFFDDHQIFHRPDEYFLSIKCSIEGIERIFKSHQFKLKIQRYKFGS